MAEIKPGIYLELKEVAIGTGATAKTQVFRNFWMTLSHEGDQVKAVLLDGDFKPTPVAQSLPEGDFVSGRLKYVPQGEKKYQALIKSLSPGPAPVSHEAESPPPTSAPKPAAGKGSGNWWEAGGDTLKSEDIFQTSSGRGQKPGEKTKSGPAQSLKKTWWDK